MRRISALIVVIALGAVGLFASPVAAAPATVSVSTAVLGPLASVPVEVSGGPGNLTDWLGVYLVGAPDWDYKTWGYLGGNGHVPPSQPSTGMLGWLEGPAAGGLYEVRFFANNGFTKLATSNAFRVTSTVPTLNPNTFYVPAGQTLSVQFSGGPGNARDWIGVVASGSPVTAHSDWKYLNDSRTAPVAGVTSGSVVLTMPTTPGVYHVYFFVDDRYVSLTQTAPITVGTIVLPTLRASSETGGGTGNLVGVGGQVTVFFNGSPGGRTDWIGLYPAAGFSGDVPATSFLDWKYTNDSKSAPGAGRTSGSVTFTMPAVAGAYQFRLLTNDGFVEIGERAYVSTTTPSVTPSLRQVPPGGRVTAYVSASLGHTTDWIGLYSVSAPDASFLDWEYLNGTRTAPAIGMYGSTSTTFTVPTAPGTYQFRLFSSDGFERITVSDTFVVS